MATSFSLSLELVLLMSWLLKHEKKNLRILINRALKNGFSKEIDLIDTFTQEELMDLDSDFADNLHGSILDFMIEMEDILLKRLNAKSNSYDLQNFSPKLQKINYSKIDKKTLLQSLKNADSFLDKSLTKSEKIELSETFFSEILKNWVPKTNEPIN